MKAYDSVDWDFALDIMSFMEFPEPYILWLKLILPPLASLSSLMGSLWVISLEKEGLGKGIPSPLTFFFWLWKLFQVSLGFESVKKGSLSTLNVLPSIFLTWCLLMTCLFFVGLMLILLGSSMDNGVLKEFHFFSGLQPNLGKCACFFTGIDPGAKLVLRAILDIPEASLPVKYLGMPLISTKLRYLDCLVLKDRML